MLEIVTAIYKMVKIIFHFEISHTAVILQYNIIVISLIFVIIYHQNNTKLQDIKYKKYSIILV